jgi:hypothetical protein
MTLIRDLPLSERPYPSAHLPGAHWTTDEAWELLDGLPVGLLPNDYRYLLAGQIAGVLMKRVDIECCRCKAIVEAARFGEIDSDFRSLIHRIDNGCTPEDIKREQETATP